MEVRNNYPKITNEVKKFIKFRRITLIVFLVSLIICGIVNASVGGKPWFLYVFGGELIFYFAFLNKPLIDNTFIKKFTVVIFIICAYLYLIDKLDETSWSYFVITIIGFSVLLVQTTVFFSAYKNQKKKFIPMFYTSVGSIIICILAIFGVLKMNWPIIVLGSLGIAVIIVLFTFFRKTIVLEFRKYFNTK